MDCNCHVGSLCDCPTQHGRTAAQDRAIEGLTSIHDDLEVAMEGPRGNLVFTGNTSDGPTAGVIYRDGSVHAYV